MSLFVLNWIVLLQIEQVVSLSIAKKSNFKFLITGGFELEDNSFGPQKTTNLNIRVTNSEIKSLAKTIVSLRTIHYYKYFGDNHFCGGTIISMDKILTAAHCIYNSATEKTKSPNEIKIVHGSKHRLKSDNTEQVSVDKVIIHPDYNSSTLENDIAILRLARRFPEDGITVQIVPIPNEKPKPFMDCTAAGWGRIINDGPFAADLTYVDLTIIPKQLCDAIYTNFKGKLLCAGDYNIFDKNSYDNGPCKGDSGGPLICNGILYGIISFGLCNGSELPYGFTNVWYYRDWIQNRGENKFKLNISFYLLITALLILKYFRH